MRSRIFLFLLVVLVSFSAEAQFFPKPKKPAFPDDPRISVTVVDYHGWPDSYAISNGNVMAIVVPALNRLMQFKYVEDDMGPLWQNRLLDGHAADPKSKDWLDFGGDKPWPAPQSDWQKTSGRAWPPPAGFDHMPATATVEGDQLVLTSAVDPQYGIRVVRRFKIDPVRAVLSVSTRYQKVSGDPVKVAVWAVTQLREPARAFAAVPSTSKMENGWTSLKPDAAQDAKVAEGVATFTPDPKHETRIGTEGSSLLWMDEGEILRIDGGYRLPGEYPDGGSSVEIGNTPDPHGYLEFGTLGPLVTLTVGEDVERTSVYTLMRRSVKDPQAEAKRLLGR